MLEIITAERVSQAERRLRYALHVHHEQALKAIDEEEAEAVDEAASMGTCLANVLRDWHALSPDAWCLCT